MPAAAVSRSLTRTARNMRRATARPWRESARWVVQIELDGVPHAERDYGDVASASHAIGQILGQQGSGPWTWTKTRAQSATRPWISWCALSAGRTSSYGHATTTVVPDSFGSSRGLPFAEPAGLDVGQGGGTATWRFDVRSRRRDPRLDPRRREGTLTQRTPRDVAVGEGPSGGRAVGGRGGWWTAALPRRSAGALPRASQRDDCEPCDEPLAQGVARQLPIVTIGEDSEVAQFAQMMRGDGDAGPKDVCDLAYAELLGRSQREHDLEALLVREHREHRTDPPETVRVGHALPKAQREVARGAQRIARPRASRSSRTRRSLIRSDV